MLTPGKSRNRTLRIRGSAEVRLMRLPGIWIYLRVARNPSRVDLERGDNFLQADLSVPIVVHETIASSCTVKRRSTPAVRMQFGVTAGRGGQRSFRRRPDHAP
jgi:hypothetical protein